MSGGSENPLEKPLRLVGGLEDQGREDAPSGPDVAELAVRAQGTGGMRDPEAFAELIRRYERSLLSIAYAALGDADKAGDVTQEAFVRAWEKLDSLQEPSRFGPWICGITRNLATDIRRRLRLAPKAGTDVIGFNDESELIVPDRMTPDPLAELNQREQVQLVTDALERLDESTRSVLVLRYYDERSSKEIGELLGLSPAAVDMRLSRARAEFRSRLKATKAFTA
jgi:RNA polymerase sigma-70 factor (ECF subfamily)